MGWFWQSSSSPKPAGSSDNSPAPTTQTQSPPAAKEPPAGDREMAMFMDMFLKDTQSSSRSAPPASQPQSTHPTEARSETSSSWLPWAAAKSRGEHAPSEQSTAQPLTSARTRTPQSLAMSEHLLPTTMSCRDAFDYAWHCHTPGSQWNAVYRYGSVRPCTELWDDFWFCMRTKSYSPEMRAEAVRAHYRAKEEAKYGGAQPSSEDVWESREDRVPPGTAFQAPLEPPMVDDAEFQRMDAERRRRIRETTDAETAQPGN